MSYVIFVIISLSFVFSACNGTMNDLSVAALTSCKDAVTLCISLCGTICLWSGIMNVAGKSGIVSGLSGLLSKPLSLLFPDISRKGSAMQYIILNFISNLLGLGNASTPLGIKAMQELKEEQKAKKERYKEYDYACCAEYGKRSAFPFYRYCTPCILCKRIPCRYTAVRMGRIGLIADTVRAVGVCF